MAELRTLKLRQTSLTDASLRPMIQMCPKLERLDISFTLVLHPLSVLPPSLSTSLQKLSLSSTRVSSVDLLAVIPNLTRLKILSLGALGEVQGASIKNSIASSTLDNNTLAQLTGVLEDFPYLEDINLVGNVKLGRLSWNVGANANAMADFISRVGRKCKVRWSVHPICRFAHL